MAEHKSRRRRKRRCTDVRQGKQRVLFYAGVKGDGSPRAWTLQELLLTCFCAATVLLSFIWLLQWLLDFDFGFGK